MKTLMQSATQKGFAARLNLRLDELGVKGHIRAAWVAHASSVSRRTAYRYLRGESWPFAGIDLDPAVFDRVKPLTDALSVEFGWLLFGERPKTPSERRFAEAVHGMSEPDQNRFLRFLIRYQNRSSLAVRLMEQFERGQISFDDLLRIGGR